MSGVARAAIAVAAILALPVLASATAAAPAPRIHTIVMDRMKFGPSPARVRAGDVILWVNRDMFRHTATARDGSFNIDLMPKASGRTIVRRAGTIAFYCRYHPAMTGQLAVAR